MRSGGVSGRAGWRWGAAAGLECGSLQSLQEGVGRREGGRGWGDGQVWGHLCVFIPKQVREVMQSLKMGRKGTDPPSFLPRSFQPSLTQEHRAGGVTGKGL